MEYKEKINEIFKNRIKIDFEKNEGLKSEKLLSNKIGCPVRELVLILYDLERVFGIDIEKGCIINSGFTTYENILEIVRHSFIKDNCQEDGLVN